MAVTKATWTQKSTGNTIHPETEVDQLKASGTTALASIISTLLKATTNADARSAISAAAASHSHSTGDITSFASKVVEAIGSETLAALGVSYSITTNGYICFGDLFGGLILQWISVTYNATEDNPVNILANTRKGCYAPASISYPHGVRATVGLVNSSGAPPVILIKTKYSTPSSIKSDFLGSSLVSANTSLFEGTCCAFDVDVTYFRMTVISIGR